MPNPTPSPTPNPNPGLHPEVPADPEALLRLHEGLVRHLLHRHFAWATRHHDDLLQEGRIALLEAGRRFDPARGGFAGYASTWIHGRMLRYLRAHSRTIRLPSHVRDRLTVVNRAVKALRAAGVDEPSSRQVAAELGWREDEVRVLMPLRRGVGSIDVPVSDDDDRGPTRAARIPDPHDAVTGLVDTVARRTVAAALLGLLDDFERRVLALRCGFGRGGPMSLAEVGAEVGCTREWVRQVEARALARLRHAALGLGVDGLAVAA